MARGLKISHERSDGTLVDQRVSTTISSIGATGGRPQWITVQGVKTVKVQFRDSDGILHANAYIIAQKGAKQFLVANAVGATESHTHSNASVTVCTLAAGADAANGAPSSTASTMSIAGYTTAGAAFYASRISNKFVSDQSNNRYRYRNSDNLATATFANVFVH
jgi:ABC-type branched-subunit amino acid transport system substrate-binding protein